MPDVKIRGENSLLVKVDNFLTATIWVETLKASGVDARLENTILGSAAGELPPEICQPEIWVPTQDYEKSFLLIDDLINPKKTTGKPKVWICPKCGEAIEEQFGQCWKCLTNRTSKEKVESFGDQNAKKEPK